LIHRTAIIDPKAELADDVSVGPYSIIGPGVQIDSGTSVASHVVIKGPSVIGKSNTIYQFASVGEDPQDKKYSHEVTYLEIGDQNIIREYCTIHRGTVQDKSITRVGSNNLLMAYAHVAHDCEIGNDVVMANGASLAGHVALDDFAILGGFTLVHQFTRIGKHSFSAMGSSISLDVPPYVMVGGRPTKPFGINSVGLERKGFDSATVQEIRRAYKTICKAGLRLEEAIKVLQTMSQDTPEIGCLLAFVQGTRRGILR
jgi:UDP-N-acetylglucosamine acyltransferase